MCVSVSRGIPSMYFLLNIGYVVYVVVVVVYVVYVVYAAERILNLCDGPPVPSVTLAALLMQIAAKSPLIDCKPVSPVPLAPVHPVVLNHVDSN